MPRRTREHELAEESERALAAALGSSMKFYTRPQIEYGIDGDIEHFDDEGNATGLHFFVQLKATDEPDLAKGLARPIAIETADYYRRASMPVLMVRYHAPSGALYARWFHQYDPYYGRRGAKTLTFRWQPSDVFGTNTATRLSAEARAFYDLRKAAIRLPLPLHVACDSSLGFNDVEFRISLREMATPRSDIVVINGNVPPPGAVYVEVARGGITAQLGSVTSATLHPARDDEDRAPDACQAAVDALVLLGLAFERIGQDSLAARLASTYLPRSVMASDLDIAFALAGAMARSHRIADALGLADALDDLEDRDRAASGFVIGLAALMTSDTLSERDQREYEAVLARRAERRRRENHDDAGVAMMNLATYLRSRTRHEEAIIHYQHALEFEPSYRGRAHFWFEFAGSLFLTGRFERAARAYDQAIKLGSREPNAVALHADSLLFAGRYRRALGQFNSYIASESGEDDDGEYRLKAFGVSYLLERLGIDDQRRETERALQAAPDCDPTAPREWVEPSLVQLEHDALWGSAWFNLALCERDAGNDEAELCCSVLATLLLPHDYEAWRNAILAAIDAEYDVMATHLLVFGQRTAGSGLTQYLVEHARTMPPPFDAAFLNAIDETLEMVEAKPKRAELRLLSENGVVEHELEVPPSGAVSAAESTSPLSLGGSRELPW